MDKKEHYRQVFLSFKNLCAADQQPCSFSKFCREHGVEHAQMRQILGGEFQNIRTLPGYTGCVNSRLYATIYENFRNLCAAGKQPGTFKDYCAGFGVSRKQIHAYLKNHGLCVVGLPGYAGHLVPGMANVKASRSRKSSSKSRAFYRLRRPVS